MPRKPKLEKQYRTFRVEGKDVKVSFFPPNGRSKSWYAYWKGLRTRKSTGQRSLEEAIEAVERELLGKQDASPSSLMTDEEFYEIQRRHYERMNAKQESVDANMEAISAFRTITGIAPIVAATADDCSRFQDEALRTPRNWRMPYKSEKSHQESTVGQQLLSAATVEKWSRALRAAFNRANVNAGQKCVRNVVPPEKLLTTNPWREFTWIKGKKVKPIRHFTDAELISIIKFFEESFPEVKTARLAAQVFLWSCARRKEISTLKWEQRRLVDGEVHFDIVGKWGIRKWFRVPSKLYEELLSIQTSSPFVFGVYPDELRSHHKSSSRPWLWKTVRSDFKPYNLADWFYHRIGDWAACQADSSACIHVFRKTGLQFAVDGESENRAVAKDASVSVRVMTTHYTNEESRQLRQKSTRTFERIVSGASSEVLAHYGYTPELSDPLRVAMDMALARKDWLEVKRLSQELHLQEQAS